MTSAPEPIPYPAVLDFRAPRLHACIPATVVAERVNAMVVLGVMNRRMKDFYDMHVILRHMRIEDGLLAEAIRTTFQKHRGKHRGRAICVAVGQYAP